MSGRTIDERVVIIEFNNRQFESGIKESLGSIDNLKKGLNLSDSAKNLTDLSTAGKNFSLAGIAEGVDTIAGRFSALGIIGVTALMNITNAAIDAGAQIVKALTIEPIGQGYGEYELKMGSIQTIMAGSGASLDTVNDKLAILNEYSDRTIYSFADMTSNIGKFTNAGVSLDNAVGAIQGISNVAALSGANSNEASRAMYNFAQSISQGSVKLIDWKSIQNANMATVEFKQQILDTAVEVGTMVKDTEGFYRVVDEFGNMTKDLITPTKNFEATLEQAWFTTDVLVNTLGKFSDESTDIGKRAYKAATEIKTLSQLFDTLKEAAGSGWATSFELFFGDFNEGIELFTGINDVIGGFISRTAEARNEVLDLWKAGGGRDDLLEAFSNLYESAVIFIEPIQEAFTKLFPPMTGERLLELTESFKKFTEGLKEGVKSSTGFSKIFKGIFAIFSILKQFFATVWRGLKILYEALAPVREALMNFAVGIADWIISIDEAIKNGDLFNKFLDKIIEGLSIFAEKIKTLWPSIKEGFNNIINFFKDLAKKINFDEFVEKIKTGIDSIVEYFESMGKVNLSGLDSFSEKIKAKLEPLSKITETIQITFTKIKEAIRKAIDYLRPVVEKLGEVFGKIRDKLKEIFGDITFRDVLAFINTLLAGGLAIGISRFVNSLTEMSEGIGEALEGFSNRLKAGTLMKIAIAIGILALSLAMLSLIDPERLAYALASITTLFADMVGTVLILNNSFGKTAGQTAITGVAGTMIGIATSVLILAVALKLLAKVDGEALGRGLFALTYLLSSLVILAKALSNSSGDMIQGTGSLLIFAGAILILGFAVKQLGKLNIGQLVKGLAGVGVLMAEITLFMKYSKIEKINPANMSGILILAGALLLLSFSVKIFAAMNIGQMLQGLAGVGVLLGEIALFTKLTAKAKDVAATAGGILILGAALVLFAVAIKMLGNLTWDQISKGLTSMGGALLAVALAVKNLPTGMAEKGLGILVIAAAMLLLAKALEQMGNFSWEQIAKGLTTLGGALIIIAVAVGAMETALPGAAALLIISVGLLLLAGALKALGSLSWEAIGKGLLAMAGIFLVIGLATLILAPIVPVLLILAAALLLLGLAAVAIGGGLLLFASGLAMIAVTGTAGVAAISLIVLALIALIPKLMTEIANGIIAFARVIIDGAPVIFEAVRTLILGLLDLLIEMLPPIVEFVLSFIVQLLEKLVEYVPQMVDAGLKLIIGLLEGIAANIEGIVQAGIDIVLNFIDGVASKIPDIIDSAFNLIISWINGLADAIRDNHDALYAAIKNLINSIIDAVLDFIPTLIGIGEDIIGGFIDGFKNMGKALVDAAKGVVGGAIDAVKNFLGIHSPSKAFSEIGKFSVQGLANGLKKFSGKAIDEAKELGKNTKDTLANAMEHLSDIINGDIDMDPTIRPVLDLADVTAGTGAINSLFSRRQALSFSSVAGDLQNGTPSQRTLNELKELAKGNNKTEAELSGTLRVQVENDKGEIIGIAQTAVTDLLRRESR